jgi:DNA-binding CsgD family transcriptional regulator
VAGALRAGAPGYLVEHVIMKLGVQGRTQAVVIAPV